MIDLTRARWYALAGGGSEIPRFVCRHSGGAGVCRRSKIDGQSSTLFVLVRGASPDVRTDVVGEIADQLDRMPVLLLQAVDDTLRQSGTPMIR